MSLVPRATIDHRRIIDRMSHDGDMTQDYHVPRYHVPRAPRAAPPGTVTESRNPPGITARPAPGISHAAAQARRDDIPLPPLARRWEHLPTLKALLPMAPGRLDSQRGPRGVGRTPTPRRDRSGAAAPTASMSPVSLLSADAGSRRLPPRHINVLVRPLVPEWPSPARVRRRPRLRGPSAGIDRGPFWP